MRSPRSLAAIGLLIVAGCASRPPVLPVLTPTLTHGIELSATPFFPQQEYQCGPAALATVLSAAGTDTRPDALVEQVYIPGRKGTLQPELLAATRRAGRIPYRIEPNLEALRMELQAGRPVLVMLNLGIPALPVWHYAVVIGMDPDSDTVILRSGTQRREHMPAHRFLQSWTWADKWGFVVLRPGERPAGASLAALLRTTAEAEPLLAPDARMLAYTAILDSWPDDLTARYGLAYALQAAGKLEPAERQYRRILARQPRHPAALNNLAEVLDDRGCRERAIAMAEQALAVARTDQPSLVGPITVTLEGLQATPATGRRCPDAGSPAAR